ncbi:hypothetical protein EV361DRAFT_982838 [Lentinula raphanica]|uniref:Uncharacterized protein n=1 Tax=Lentinula raphanica TaxID=153919 RepID=A0AA38NWB6_9AGAR|nr:hypothetical protein F5878DRAFT_667145 [Lentinula raphanica]KAJ3963867.1 hypothetical protein EV361DRAFT_982838 [Lentinula raphanica]
MEHPQESTAIFVETKHKVRILNVPVSGTFPSYFAEPLTYTHLESLDNVERNEVLAEPANRNDSPNEDETPYDDFSCFNAGIVFASTRITMSGHPRRPERFAQALPVKVMVLYVQGSVLVLVADLQQKKPGIILPGSGDFNETFLEWEIQRCGQDLRLDLTETQTTVRTHLRFSFPSKSEYLSFKGCVSPSVQNQRALSYMDKSYSDRDWILKLFEALA